MTVVPAEAHRFEVRYRRDASCPPDLEIDGENFCIGAFRLELVSERPAQAFGGRSQFALEFQIVLLDDHAVDGVGKRISTGENLVGNLHDFLGAVGYPEFVCVKTEILESRQVFGMPFVSDVFGNMVGEESQIPLGAFLRILELERSRCRVPRILESLEPVLQVHRSKGRKS